MSYRSDQETYPVDAFSLSWKSWSFYCFPSLSYISRLTQKVMEDQAIGVKKNQ